MKHDRSKADPCLCHSWTSHGLVLWMSWVDDCLVAGNQKAVATAKQQMKNRFDCDDVGELRECVGCKVDVNKRERSVTLTQPLLLQSCADEFNLPEERAPRTQAIAGDVLMRGEVKDQISAQDQKTCRSGVGKPLHMMR
jgi:hypothetical protein